MTTASEDDPKRVRWEGLRRSQLGFVNNLYLGLAVGVVVFELNQVIGRPCSAGLKAAVFSMVLGSLSALCGLLTSVTRLLDYRATADIHGTSDEQKKARLRERARYLGRATWGLLWIQLATFGLALIASAIWVWAVLTLPEGRP